MTGGLGGVRFWVMAAQAPEYVLYSVPGESHFRLDQHQVELVYADWDGDGVYQSLAFRRDLRDFATHLRVGDRSRPSLQASLAILADALATTDSDPDSAGDARAAAGCERFMNRFVSRLPRGQTRTRIKRDTVLDEVARLGI